MKKNLTELVFILDRSGSMGGLEQDTIGGFNAMLTRQKEQEGEANVTTILFDHEVQLLHDRFPLKAGWRRKIVLPMDCFVETRSRWKNRIYHTSSQSSPTSHPMRQ